MRKLIPAAIMVGLAAINVAGVVRIPVGPLGAAGAGSGASMVIPHSSAPQALYVVPFVENDFPIAVTVERIVPLGTSVAGVVSVIGSLPFDASVVAERDLINFVGIDRGAGWSDPEPATDVPVEPRGDRESAGRAWLVKLDPDPARETTLTNFEVLYRFGPLAFVGSVRSTGGHEIIVCGPERPLALEGEIGCGEPTPAP